MLKAVQQKVKDLSILDQNDTVLSIIQVTDLLKKDKHGKKAMKEEFAALIPANKYFLIATIKRASNDSTPIIYLVKSNEKVNDLKLKLTWNLIELKTVTQSAENCQFEIAFNNQSTENRRALYQCEKQQDRSEFLTTLWKLSEEFLKTRDRPKFVNFQIEDKNSAGNASVNTSANATKNDPMVSSNHFELTKFEEESLLKLMSECDFASSNAEEFMSKLHAELVDLDTSNIESIMNSEENTQQLMEMLDTAVGEIDKIDNRLKDYEGKISAVGDAVRIVGERDNVIQLQQNNQHGLLDMLENMVQMLDFSEQNVKVLTECGLSTKPRIQKSIEAANQLLDIIETEFPPGFTKMKAYEEQMNMLERLKLKFCNSVYNHLKNAIGHATNKHLESYKIIDNSLNSLPPHKQIHEDLIIFKDLNPWVYRSNCYFSERDQRKTYFNDIKENYIETVQKLYQLEIEPFCSCAKNRIQNPPRPKNTASMETLKGTFISKSNTTDMFTIKTDAATKEMLKLVFTKLLNQLSMTIQNEQTFCQEFFNIKQSSMVDSGGMKSSRTSSDASMVSNAYSKQMSNVTQADTSKNDLLILREIFTSLIEDQVKSIMESIIKTENMMVVFLYSDLLFRVLVSHNNSQFMHQPLVSLLRISKQKCDEYIDHFKTLVNDYKCNKKEKIGILRYVAYFEEFMKEAEICWEPIKKDMYEKLCNIYQQIVDEIYKGIERIAAESMKTPSDVIKFQNYHQMHHIMRSINGLKDSTKYAKEQYTSYKASYIKEHFGRPLEKIHYFFERVEAKIAKGYKPEDISYQLDLSANNLREIIKDFPAKEVKRGLESLYTKVEKHLADNSSLLEVVWRDMSHEFIRQYKNYIHLTQTCYPGHKIEFGFTEAEICEIFTVIAQKH